LSESHTDTPLPGGGRRIARRSPEIDPADAPPRPADDRPDAVATGARRSHRAAGPPSTLETEPAAGRRRRAPTHHAATHEIPTAEPASLAQPATTSDESAELGPPAPPATRSDEHDEPAEPVHPRWAASTSTPTAFALASAEGDPPVIVAPKPRRDDGPRPWERQLSPPSPTTEETPQAADVVDVADLMDVASPSAPPDSRSHDVLIADPVEPIADEPEREHTAWDGPIVTATYPRPGTVSAEAPGAVDDRGAAEAAGRSVLDRIAAALVLVGTAAALVAGLQVAETEGWLDHVADPVVRAAALASTWCAVVLLSRRCGGRTIIIATFSAVVFALAGTFPETWALAGGAVTAGTVFGLLAMVYTRPAGGVGLVRELLVSASIGVLGALVVAGYHVELRPYRFRMMVLGLVLICAFLLAWRLGHGARSLGRRGGAIIVVGVVVLAGSLAYVQAVRSWGSPSLVHNLDDFKASISDLLGAAPRPVEALIGFPALVWGVAARRRRRQGWWMCAFGALGAAGITSSLIHPDVGFWSAMASTGYDVVIGLALGALVVFADGLLTGGGGRRAEATRDLGVDRPEPARFASLL
jgi:hypothetical protein